MSLPPLPHQSYIETYYLEELKTRWNINTKQTYIEYQEHYENHSNLSLIEDPNHTQKFILKKYNKPSNIDLKYISNEIYFTKTLSQFENAWYTSTTKKIIPFSTSLSQMSSQLASQSTQKKIQTIYHAQTYLGKSLKQLLNDPKYNSFFMRNYFAFLFLRALIQLHKNKISHGNLQLQHIICDIKKQIINFVDYTHGKHILNDSDIYAQKDFYKTLFLLHENILPTSSNANPTEKTLLQKIKQQCHNKLSQNKIITLQHITGVLHNLQKLCLHHTLKKHFLKMNVNVNANINTYHTYEILQKIENPNTSLIELKQIHQILIHQKNKQTGPLKHFHKLSFLLQKLHLSSTTQDETMQLEDIYKLNF